ncbi:MAG TPA: efflux RND transporter periplasmic adaptor subunit [Acidobacteriota bacterium]|nr:efflux RND transporter periplasmic adaptor subunit [Acidobacteriota bacterium]
MDFLRRQIEERPWLVLLALLAAFVLGWQLSGPAPASGDQSQAQSGQELWTCAMHPQIRQPEPGDCPICGMDLIPVSGAAGDGLASDRLQLTQAAKRLAEIETTPAQRRYASNTVRLKGQVTYDETLLETLTAWVPGRLDQLYVDYVGVKVAKGQHLAQMYSPEIYVAEKELQEAAGAVRAAKQRSNPRALESAQAILEATRDKLRLWGVPQAVIRSIESGGKPSDRIDIVSPVGGLVVEKKVSAGEYVDTGTPLYSIANLEAVWVTLEAYESDLPWLRFGQSVEVRVPALPGESLTGTISLIDPVVDPKTRTVMVRVNVPNPQHKLKPGMLATGVVESRLAANGQVMEPNLAGKWISPMHPEIVKDQPGSCDICGMPLVPSEELGFAQADQGDPPLVIPASALLFTGKRSVVYVELPGQDKPTYQLREVEVGARAGDEYIILEGLEEGDLVVTHGNFKIDSAMQLQARSSMMAPPGEGDDDTPTVDPAPEAFLVQLDALLDAYLDLQQALAADDPSSAEAASRRLRQTFGQVDAEPLQSESRAFWTVQAMELENPIERLDEARQLDAYRQAFYDLSNHMLKLLERFGHGLDTALVEVHCPMAFTNQGADWIQRGDQIENPYLGQPMLTCGSVEERFPQRIPDPAPATARGDHAEHSH